ncbi:MAG: hypothetical protein LBD16_07660 [Oscillospiraceae bacterium]|nr:hypothetical protein [Oscillospiraceae bacterium]
MSKKQIPIVVLLALIAAAEVMFAAWAFLPLIGVGEETVLPTRLTLYDGPSTISRSAYARVWVNGAELFVYDTPVNTAHVNKGDYDVSTLTPTPVTYFDFADGAVEVEIEMYNADDIAQISSAAVSPLSLGIAPAVSDRRVKFTITEAGQYTVQFNGSSKRALHLFANPIEENVPDRNDPNVIWIDPGEWIIEDGITLESGKTLYISGGAVVHTQIGASFAQNVTVRGRGIIDGSNWDTWMGSNAKVPIDFRYCKNVNVEGLIFLNSNAWVFNSFETENAIVDNVKLISARPNGDGFTLQSCRNYIVRNGFARTWDDTLVVKNYEGNTDGIIFRNMIVWTDLAQSMEIGYETNKGKQENSVISNVLFEDITVINAFHKPVMSIHNSDDALVTDVVYRNITVENAAMGLGDAADNKQLIDLNIAGSGWSTTKTRGTIRNVSFENINVLAATEKLTFRIVGYDDEHDIQNVSIKGLTLLGEKIASADQLALTKRFMSGLTVEE